MGERRCQHWHRDEIICLLSICGEVPRRRSTIDFPTGERLGPSDEALTCAKGGAQQEPCHSILHVSCGLSKERMAVEV